jgi:hypothetical protein
MNPSARIDGARPAEVRAAQRAPALVNAMTVDVEDYFQVSAFAPYIRRDEWDSRECRVERNVDRILAMLADRQTHATFFTLGWIAERYPQMCGASPAPATRSPATAMAMSARATSRPRPSPRT